MFFERKSERFSALARASIHGAFHGEALLKDLSVTGCLIECTALIDVVPEKQYKIKIFPELASNVDAFELIVVAHWVSMGNCCSEAGFGIVESPKGKHFERYTEYIAYRAEHE